MRAGNIFVIAGMIGWASAAVAQSLVARSELAMVPVIQEYAPLTLSELKGPVGLAEAVHRALTANSAVILQGMQVQAEEGNVQQALGAYDTEADLGLSREGGTRPLRQQDVTTFAAAGSPESRAEAVNALEYRAGLKRTLRSGAELEAAATVNSSSSSLNVASGTPRQTTAGLRFGIRVPLLRNAGGQQNASALKAREYERDASVEDLLQTSSTTVLAVVQAYWELAARWRRADILRHSERRAEDLVAEIDKLVAADQIPGAELDLAQASAGEKRASRVAEEQALQVAWNTLGRQLQADTVDDVVTTALHLDALPEIDERAPELIRRTQLKRTDASARRADVRAARLREKAAHIQVLAAEDAIKVQLDFVGSLSTNGLTEGSSSPSFDLSRPYPLLNLGVQIRMPLANNAARGLVATRLAAHRQALVRLHEAESNVAPALATALSSLRRILSRHEDTAAAVVRYEQAVKNEYVKRRLGLATLIDVINVQDRLDSARLLLLQLRQDYAGGIAQVMFESGELVGREGDSFQINLAVLGGAVAAGNR